MAKLYFTRTVKYNGTIYTSKAAVEVLDGDVEGLKSAGLVGKILEEPKIDGPKDDENPDEGNEGNQEGNEDEE